MAAHNPTIRHLASTGAAEKRHHGQVSASTATALAEARIADYIRKTVDAAPQLTADQRLRLAAILLRGDAA